MNPLQNYISSISAKKKASPFDMAPKTTTSPLSTTPMTGVSPFNAANTSQALTTSTPVTPSATTAVLPKVQPVTSYTPKESYMSGLTEADVRANLANYEAQNRPQTSQTSVNQPIASPTSSAAPSNPQSAFLKSYRDYLSQYSQSLKPSSEIFVW